MVGRRPVIPADQCDLRTIDAPETRHFSDQSYPELRRKVDSCTDLPTALTAVDRAAAKQTTEPTVACMTRASDAVWIRPMADSYERLLVPAVFAPFARDLAGRVASLAPSHILELAAGTGVVTRELLTAAPEAELTATDLNPAMVEVGSELAAGARWEPADATRLPFADQLFDCVVCQFGVMFFPDKPTAFSEVARVLAPGGHFVMSTWATVGEHDFSIALEAGLRDVFPHDVPAFLSEIPHGYADVERVVADLRLGGLESIEVTSITLIGSAQSATDIAVGFCTGTPLRAAIEERGDLDEAIDAVARELRTRLGPDPVTGRMTALVIDVVR